jgi:hypothetical protein
MFPSTLPVGTPDLMRISDFRRYLHQQQVVERATSTRLTSLSPSLLLDLTRHERGGQASDLLEVVAAALRHGRSLLLHLGFGHHVIPLTLFPAERLAHCPLTPEQLLNCRLQAFEVLQVEPALLQPPGGRERLRVTDPALYSPLGPLTWALALRGARDTLLPELAGSAAYRVTPGADLRALPLGGPLAAAVHRLRRDAANLREIADWPGLDRERAVRLLNALYLQSALIVSRVHPAATNEGWRSHPDPH